MSLMKEWTYLQDFKRYFLSTFFVVETGLLFLCAALFFIDKDSYPPSFMVVTSLIIIPIFLLFYFFTFLLFYYMLYLILLIFNIKINNLIWRAFELLYSITFSSIIFYSIYVDIYMYKGMEDVSGSAIMVCRIISYALLLIVTYSFAYVSYSMWKKHIK